MDKAHIIIFVCILTQVVVPDVYGKVISRVYLSSLEAHSGPEIAREAVFDANSQGVWFNNVSPQSAGLTNMLPFWWHFLRPMLQKIVINSSFKQQLQQEYDNELEREIQIENNGEIGEFKLEGNIGNGQEIEISNERSQDNIAEQNENNYESNGGQEEPEAHDNAQENLIGDSGSESGFEGDGFINTVEEDGSSGDLLENTMEAFLEPTHISESKLKEIELNNEDTNGELPEVNKESLSENVETNEETKPFEVEVKTENEQSWEETKTEVENNIKKVERSEGETSR